MSLGGTWTPTVAQGWLVCSLPRSALYLGLTGALRFLPVLPFGTYGGVPADRLDERHVLMATQPLFVAQALALFSVVAADVVQFWMVWVLAPAMGFIDVADDPARQSLAVDMVGPDDLASAVGLYAVIVNASRIAGPALAGVLMRTR